MIRRNPVFPYRWFVGGCLLTLAPVFASGWAADIMPIPGPPVSTSATSSPAQIDALMKVPQPVERLRIMELNFTPDDLRAALTNSAVFIRTTAVKAIANRGDRALLPDLAKTLQDERAQVRVEAALALDSYGDPSGKVALIAEIVKARQAQINFSSGKVKRNYWASRISMRGYKPLGH